MQTIKIFTQRIEVHDNCTLVNPIRKGLETVADLTCEQPDELVRFDAAADKVKQNVADLLAEHRERIVQKLEQQNEEEE